MRFVFGGWRFNAPAFLLWSGGQPDNIVVGGYN
jgi:hypothetical protein